MHFRKYLFFIFTFFCSWSGFFWILLYFLIDCFDLFSFICSKFTSTNTFTRRFYSFILLKIIFISICPIYNYLSFRLVFSSHFLISSNSFSISLFLIFYLIKKSFSCFQFVIFFLVSKLLKLQLIIFLVLQLFLFVFQILYQKEKI